MSHIRPCERSVSATSSRSTGSSSTWSTRSDSRRSGTGRSRRALWRRLVDDGPEPAEQLDGVDELVEGHRLDDIGVHAELVTPHQILFLGQRHVKGRAAVHHAFAPHLAAMAVNDAAHVGQSDTGTLELVAAVQSLKDAE